MAIYFRRRQHFHALNLPYRQRHHNRCLFNVILDGDGEENSFFLFQVLSMAAGISTIVLTNRAKAETVLLVISAASAHGATSVPKAPFWPEGGAITFRAWFTLHGCAISRAAIGAWGIHPGVSVEPQFTAITHRSQHTTILNICIQY